MYICTNRVSDDYRARERQPGAIAPCKERCRGKSLTVIDYWGKDSPRPI
ncbi:hypothetical protein HC931_26955 [Candidatus Gracilibacteria bacterium]|nr:hypothetical protein [Candidatus Gracilibacteria bacterium]NJM90345.1 hypothetical protein [Hydrococcus sp. RU_2_2]NJP22173.1 hypothetical protein [Hydrococcus sp. CRU_1_1]